jgi:diguanylate cyclase (GGDEF)-like protein
MERTRDLAEANDKLAALSMTDGLTGIANRRRFDEALEKELQRAARAHAPLALLMLDVDYFKRYNDFYGHPRGDACLRRLAALLQSHARRGGDLAARYGGEEFALIAANLDPEGALALAEAIRAEFEALRQPHERSPLGRVTASIGVVALVPDEADSGEAMLRMADQALYRAKEQGRNQVAMAPPAAVVHEM